MLKKFAKSNFWKAIERRFKGHRNFGPITLYGANAMHWAVNIRTKRWGWVCFRLPLPCYGSWWAVYFYVSPNATPWASTYYWSTTGRDTEFGERGRARQRWLAFGHNFNTDICNLDAINGYSVEM